MNLFTDAFRAMFKDIFREWHTHRSAMDKTKAYYKCRKDSKYVLDISDFDGTYDHFVNQAPKEEPAKTVCAEHPSGECEYYRACNVCCYKKMHSDEARRAVEASGVITRMAQNQRIKEMREAYR